MRYEYMTATTEWLAKGEPGNDLGEQIQAGLEKLGRGGLLLVAIRGELHYFVREIAQ